MVVFINGNVREGARKARRKEEIINSSDCRAKPHFKLFILNTSRQTFSLNLQTI